MPSGSFAVSTSSGMEFVDITEQARQTVQAVSIQEGCDPAVRHDLLGLFQRLAPQSHPCRHAEGNSPAHALASLTGSSVTVIIAKGELRLGTWQRIFFCEYDGPRSRLVFWKALAG